MGGGGVNADPFFPLMRGEGPFCSELCIQNLIPMEFFSSIRFFSSKTYEFQVFVATSTKRWRKEKNTL